MMVNLPGRDVALVGVPEPDTTSGGHAPAHPPLQTVDGGTSEVRVVEGQALNSSENSLRCAIHRDRRRLDERA